MQIETLESICTLVSSGGTPSRKRPEYFTSDTSGHFWVKSKELLDSSIDDTEEKITDEGLNKSSAKFYPENTVLVAMYGANVGQLGWLRRPATVNQAICGLVIDKSKADWRYVFYSLLLNRSDLTVQAQGAAQQNLNQDLIRQFPISLPQLSEQHRIVGILAAYDELIETNQRRIRILEDMARNLYREWFIHFRYPGHESVPLVDSSLPLRFLFYVLPTLNFINSDAAVPGLSRNQAYTLEILVPPTSLLNQFCELAETFEWQAATLQRQTNNLRRTRDLLLPRLLSGQVELTPEKECMQ